MPRVARELTDGGIYHILNRGNAQQRVYHKDADYLGFINLTRQLSDTYGVQILAYCLMPNHFHLLVRAGKGEDLSRGMQWFMTTQVRRYHKQYGTSGHLWQGRYRSFGIQNDDHLLTVARYVEGNPVRANMVATATDWVWSSHRERCGLEQDSLLSPMPVPLGNDWTNYVDTPLTGVEMAKVKKRIERQSRGLAPQVPVPFGTGKDVDNRSPH